MDFRETLRRYHISPLQYENGQELTENDYSQLFGILQKYYYAKTMCGYTRTPVIPENLKNRVINLQKRSLFDLTSEEIMDTLMEFEGEKVI